MSNIDWRAFWTSVATVIFCLIIYATLIEPVVKKYNIRVVNPDGDDKKTPETKKAS